MINKREGTGGVKELIKLDVFWDGQFQTLNGDVVRNIITHGGHLFW